MTEKYTVFLIGLFVFVPIATVITRFDKRFLNLVFVALVFGTTQPESLFGLPVDINFLSREWYRGTARGIEISYLDFLALLLYFGSLSYRSKERDMFIKPQIYKYLMLFFIWSLFTVILISDPKIFGFFELSKIARGIFIFMAVSVFLRSPEHLRLFLYALLMIAFFEISVALIDRYFYGIHRVQATLPHPNSLSMYLLQILPFMISAWFAHDVSPTIRNLCALASILIAGGVILTISRTGFAAMLIIVFLSIVLNTYGRWTSRNLGVLCLAVIIGLLMVGKSWDSLSSRFVNYTFKNEYLSDKGDRGSYFRKGLPALYENPIFGVGLNNWSYWISNKYAVQAGYESYTYPSTKYPPEDLNRQQPPAHNLYLITAVELGFIGFILLMALFWKWLRIASIGMFSGRGELSDRIRIGALLSLIGVLMQSVTEWEFRQPSLFFFGLICMAVSAYTYSDFKKVSKVE